MVEHNLIVHLGTIDSNFSSYTIIQWLCSTDGLKTTSFTISGRVYPTVFSWRILEESKLHCEATHGRRFSSPLMKPEGNSMFIQLLSITVNGYPCMNHSESLLIIIIIFIIYLLITMVNIFFSLLLITINVYQHISTIIWKHAPLPLGSQEVR